jgi:hypothetical protein
MGNTAQWRLDQGKTSRTRNLASNSGKVELGIGTPGCNLCQGSQKFRRPVTGQKSRDRVRNKVGQLIDRHRLDNHIVIACGLDFSLPQHLCKDIHESSRDIPATGEQGQNVAIHIRANIDLRRQTALRINIFNLSQIRDRGALSHCETRYVVQLPTKGFKRYRSNSSRNREGITLFMGKDLRKCFDLTLKLERFGMF